MRDHQPLFLEPPIDWAEDPGDDNWSYQLNALYPLAPIFVSLERNYDPELHALARLVFEDWIRFNIDEDRDHPFRWNDMATGVRASYLAQLIKLERDHGTEENLERFARAGEKHLDELVDPEKLARNNHGIFQLVGIASLCQVLEERGCSDGLEYAEERFNWLFSLQFNEEGVHLEHSPSYHLLAIRAFVEIETSSLLSLSESNRATLAEARKNLQYMIHPDGGFAEFGDTESRTSRLAGMYDSQALWLVSKGRSGEKPDEGVRLFPASGMVAIRDGVSDSATSSYLFFSAAHHSRVHKHLDTGSFEWFDQGVRVLVDSGKWGYDLGRERTYVLSQQAHNVIVTDGVARSPGDIPEARAPLHALESDGIYLIEASLPAPRQLLDAEHRRLILMKPGEWLIVSDLVSDWLPSRHTQWFQLNHAAELEETEQGYSASFPDSAKRLMIRPLREIEGRQGVRGQTSSLLGWYADGYRSLTAAWQVGFSSSGRHVELTTLFRWISDGEAADITPVVRKKSDKAISFCWSEAGVFHGVVLERSPSGWHVGPCYGS